VDTVTGASGGGTVTSPANPVQAVQDGIASVEQSLSKGISGFISNVFGGALNNAATQAGTAAGTAASSQINKSVLLAGVVTLVIGGVAAFFIARH